MKIIYRHAELGCSFDSQYGWKAHVWYIVHCFRALGHVVYCVGDRNQAYSTNMRKRYQNVKDKCPRGMAYLLRDVYRIWHGIQNWRVSQLFSPHDIDLVYERSAFYLPALCMSHAWSHSIHFLEVNAPIEEQQYKQENSCLIPLAHAIECRKYKSADRVITVSSALKNYLVKRYRINPVKICVIPNAADVETFFPSEDMRIRLRNGLGLQHNQILAGMVASMGKMHGVAFLLRAMKILLSRYDDLHLVLLGGDREMLLDELAHREIYDTGRVKVIGRVAQPLVVEYINAMDICLIPSSNWYCSPIKLFEYGACAKPVLFPNTSPLLEVLTPFEDGMVFLKGDVQDFVDKFTVLVEDSELRGRLGRKWYRKVREEHTWQRNALRILNMVSSCVR